MTAVRRICAKVLLINPGDRVLLFSGIDRTSPDDPPVWFPVGGAVEDGETLEAAAIRETSEETGFAIDDSYARPYEASGSPASSTRAAATALSGSTPPSNKAAFSA